ncbi:type I-F CRISPR-associated protein Csy2 [Betaproteobacteria bacterium]|nr:type I-F CRISPR-associated protein Csy2 [Betaproteobacteria bacterium]GHT99906.1 type I-F CRISPR-associated protein Csy2 [Betaproteobacteria bacterium]GHU23410.1 type I-F CRISPR-associated protein Csy2 [Betaproteobacteria bacterium]
MTAAKPEALLLLPRLTVQNANAISSPMTWGFPAPSAFTGFVHALHRRISHELDLQLDGVGIICHHFEPQVSQPAGKRTQVFKLTRNPLDLPTLRKLPVEGKTASIVEEGRAHLRVSLLIGASGTALDDELPETLAHRLYETANSMRLAGGSIVPDTSPLTDKQKPQILLLGNSSDEHEHRKKLLKLRQRLLPGFALVSREAQLHQHWQQLLEKNPQASELDALLDLSRLNIVPTPDEQGTPHWQPQPHSGYLVPIPAGYGALSPLYEPGQVRNARDPETPMRFVETLLTLGEWLSPHRVKIEKLHHLLWYHQATPETGLYRCTTPLFAQPPEKEHSHVQD